MTARTSPRRARRAAAATAGPMTDINTTPLIDVMLVLLIMLIITIPIQLHSVDLNMPAGRPPAAAEPPPTLRIEIDAAGVVRWDGVPLADAAELETRIAALATASPQPEVHLRPDRAAPYDTVARVLATAQRLGLTRLGIVGSEQVAR